MFVDCRRADAKHGGSFRVGHLFLVVKLEHSAVLLCQVVVDDLLQLLQQLFPLLVLLPGCFLLKFFLQPPLQLSVSQDVQALVSCGSEQIASDAFRGYFRLASPHLDKHLMHGILGILGILYQGERHAIHVRIAVLEEALELLFTVIHHVFLTLLHL